MKLTLAELETLEKSVRDGVESFVAAGIALRRIMDTGGHFLRGFASFNEYCKATFGFTDRHGRRMMLAAKISGEILEISGQKIFKESVARQLTPLLNDSKLIGTLIEQVQNSGETLSTISAKNLRVLVRGIAGTQFDAKAPIPGTCPYCHKLPDQYSKSERGYTCSNCNCTVNLAPRRISIGRPSFAEMRLLQIQ